ncbi:MAG TPA: ABC transporter ATP-binding protein [Peptococcaceae bacterium]|nr:ABC transporter ATP-binding protein [Clostridia bacterium]HPZ71499.1 ABC transporter ATP-binding protein [Peptococcaceae bacterium]HQD54446.1 ABC transporter ATP-binding protein [Peptococcaceae bacterium]
MAELVIKEVTKAFNKGTINEKTALDDLSLTLEKGDFVTVIGSNGAGKSSLLNAIAGLWPVDKGRIWLAGQDLTGLPDYQRAALIGRVFQDPMLGTAASMTIEENLALAAKRGMRRGLKKALTYQRRKQMKEELAKLGLGLENRLITPVGLLSGGQRQALTLLMAIYQEPQLLLLDEHTAALDPKTGEVVLKLTKNIVESLKLTTIMVTHNIKDALKIGNRTIMMHEGRIVLDISGPQREQMTTEDILRLFAETSGSQFSNDRMLLVQ